MSWDDEIVVRDVTNAGLVVSDRINRDVAAQTDLEEALEASRYTSHPYSTHPREWPPLVEVMDTWELPPVLIERYNAAGGEGTALCGVFPEIHRAWASVDNSLFLWRFDKWDGQCPEYSGEEQAICAVGLAKSKPGVFVQAIQYLLVLATPVELILVGVCCCGRGDGTDPYEEVSLQLLPEYAIPSDGVTMTCITCTDKGRIFLAGRDGHIYEMHYTTGSGWNKRCRKVCLTVGLGSVISRWIVPHVLKFGAIDPIVEMVVDNERHILYVRTEDMKLQVFVLGPKGDGPLKKVAEEKNLINQKDAHYGGRQSTGSRPSNRSAKPSIICISPLSTLESKWLHLVAVLSDGRRMYLSTAPSSGNSGAVGGLSGFNNSHHKPNCLKVVTTRPSPPLGITGGLAFGALSLSSRTQNEDLALKVESAYYSAGAFVLSDSSSPTMSSLLIVSRDSSTQSSASAGLGTTARTSRALRESVSSLPVEGRMLYVADVLPSLDMAATVQSLYSELEFSGFESSGESSEKASGKLLARGDLSTQHILPRRRIVVFSTMGMMEVVFNRPVDILRRLLESNSPRSLLEDFFNRFGAGEAAAMCLLLAAKIVQTENLISNIVSEKAAEAFEDPRVVGMPQLEGSSAFSNTRTAAGGFSMGQVVQEAEPIFSGAHEGLCLCSSRLLLPVWELPFMVMKGGLDPSNAMSEDGIVACRLSSGPMQVLENKIRALEKFLRSRRNQRRGLYGCVAGLGDLTGSILYGTGSDLGAGDQSMVRNLFGAYTRSIETGDGRTSNKRPRLPYSPAELAAMEVRAMECIRQLLLRSAEALFLLQLLCQNHVTRLIQSFDVNLRQELVQLTFHQLVCSEEGDRLATRLISSLMEYYTGPDGRGTVDDISARLREGCPSYYKESDYKFYLAVEFLERAAVTSDDEEKENLAREAFNFLSKVPESADLRTVCKRFEDLRFYEAVVRLPLQKAQALDPAGDAFNEQLDAGIREHALARLQQCYEIITSALRSLKGEASQREFGFPMRPAAQSSLNQASRDKYIRQIVQLGVQSSDRVFHEYLYRTMIDLGLENELLEYGGPDLVPFLQNAGRESSQEVRAVSAVTSTRSREGLSGAPIPSKQTKYFDLLARYYVLKRQHALAAHVLLRLAERRSTDAGDVPTLEQRRHYLSNAVLQAKNTSNSGGLIGSARGAFDNGLLDLLEGKLAVLRFQIKIKEDLEAIASRLESPQVTSESAQNESRSESNLNADTNFANTVREKARDLSLDLKSITQLYNEYAVPFELWEICLEMLYFANYSGDADSSIARETWARLIDQALSKGGIAEACLVLKRVGSHIYPGEGVVLPLDLLCLHLEKAALERLASGVESVGDEDVVRALLAACKGATEPVLNTYEQLLSNGAILPSPNLRLRFLRSVLVVLREWAMSVFAQRMGTSATGASLILGGTFSLGQTTAVNRGVRGQYSSLYGSALSSSQQVPASAKGVGPSTLESRSGYASAMPESPKFTSSDYVSSSTHGYGKKGDQFFSEKLSEYPSVERRQYGERQSAYVGGRELQSESSGRYADPVGFSHQHQPEIYDRVDQASLLRQEQMLKAQSLQSTSLDGGARQTDYLAARSATIRHSTQDLMPYSGRLDGDPHNLSMLSGSSYGAQHAPSILGAAPRRNADDLMYAQSSSNPGYGVSLPPGRDYATGKGLHGTSLEPDFMSRGGHTRIDERKDDRGAYVRELELREEERRREHFREREKDREREKERQRERERERERAERERERERERKRILERREKERERERKRAAEVKHERTPLRISKDRHVSSLVKDERPTRRESPRHEALHRRHSPVKEKRREYACKVYSSSLVDVERDYLSLDKRYPKLFISPEFTKVVVNWPKGNLKLSFNTPVSFEHDFVEEESSPEQKEVSTEQLAEEPVESKHGSTVWNAKMILMSGLSKNALEDLSSEKCPDDRMPHICSILRFSVLKKDRSFMAIGGPWDDAVDGGDPSVDDSSLVQTIHRYAKNVTQLDLLNCQNWNRFLEIHYDRIGEDGFFSHKEVTVLFVPDLSECLPSLDTWRDQWLAHKKAAAERAGQLSLKKEKSKEKKEGLKDIIVNTDKETDSTKAVKQVDKSAKTKDSASSGQVDVNKKEKNGSQPKGDEAGIEGNGNTDKNIVKKDVVEMSQDGKSIEKKESEATAGSQSSNAKSGKKKIVKKVVKQKVADKNTATENTKNEENDKLDEKDVGEKNAKSETKGQQQEPSADPSVKTFIRKKVGKKVTEAKITQDESMQPEVKIENEPQCSEGKSEIKPDPSVAVSVQGTGVRTTIKKKIIKRIPKRKVTGVGANTGSAESQKDGDSEEKKVVQLGTKNKNVSEKTVEAGNPACEPKILEKKMTPKTKSKTEIFSKQDEKTGSGTKIETEAEKQKVPQKDSQIGNSDRSKDQEKSKDEKEKKEKDGKFDSRGNKSDKEAKEKRNLEEPPRHPGLFLQTKWSKDSKLRSLSLSLDSLLGYTDKDIEEPTFEVSLFAETLFEMLQYQMGSRLLTFLQKLRLRFVMKRNQRKRQREEPSEKGSKERPSAKRPKIAEPSMGMKSTESEMLDAAHLKEEKAATKGESASGDVVKIERPKEEGVESEKLEDEGAEMENTDDEIDYDEDPEEDPEEEPMEDEEMQDANHQDEHNEELNLLNNEGEAKTSGETEPEKVAGTEKEEAEGSCKEKTNNETAETNEGANPGEERKEAPVINKVSVDKELLQAFRFFDRNQVGYIRVEDMRLIIHSLGKFLSHRDVKELVQSALLESNTGRDDRILYNKLVRMSNI